MNDYMVGWLGATMAGLTIPPVCKINHAQLLWMKSFEVVEPTCLVWVRQTAFVCGCVCPGGHLLSVADEQTPLFKLWISDCFLELLWWYLFAPWTGYCIDFVVIAMTMTHCWNRTLFDTQPKREIVVEGFHFQYLCVCVHLCHVVQMCGE